MATPKLAIESAVHQFLQHWNLGLCPTLSLKTQTNGNIDIAVMLSVSPNSHPQDIPYVSQSRRSGYGSRLRRRERRRTKTQDELIDHSYDEEAVVESCSFTNRAFEAVMETVTNAAGELELSHSASVIPANSQDIVGINEDEKLIESSNHPSDLEYDNTVYDNDDSAPTVNGSSTSVSSLRQEPFQQVSTPVIQKDTQEIRMSQGAYSLPFNALSTNSTQEQFTLNDFNRIMSQVNNIRFGNR